MWTTRNQSGEVVVGFDHPADRASLPQPSEDGPQARPDPVALPRSWALFAGLVGPVVAAFCIAVEPAPADPHAPEPLIGTLLAVALLVAMAGATWLGARRQVQALSWASAVGAVLVLMTISCPLSGHHASVGMWWAAQLIVSGAAWAVAAGGRFVVTRGARTTA
jgi:NADH:ubiquinone oxidoreductase subunit 6 (subunit J)